MTQKGDQEVVTVLENVAKKWLNALESHTHMILTILIQLQHKKQWIRHSYLHGLKMPKCLVGLFPSIHYHSHSVCFQFCFHSHTIVSKMEHLKLVPSNDRLLNKDGTFTIRWRLVYPYTRKRIALFTHSNAHQNSPQEDGNLLRQDTQLHVEMSTGFSKIAGIKTKALWTGNGDFTAYSYVTSELEGFGTSVGVDKRSVLRIRWTIVWQNGCVLFILITVVWEWKRKQNENEMPKNRWWSAKADSNPACTNQCNRNKIKWKRNGMMVEPKRNHIRMLFFNQRPNCPMIF